MENSSMAGIGNGFWFPEDWLRDTTEVSRTVAGNPCDGSQRWTLFALCLMAVSDSDLGVCASRDDIKFEQGNSGPWTS